MEKENTHIPSQLLDYSSLDWDYIPEQGKVLDTVQLLDITTRVLFFLTKLTATRVFMHTSWLPEKPAAARLARGRDKVQTCYSHQGNNDTRILGEKFQEFGGRLQ